LRRYYANAFHPVSSVTVTSLHSASNVFEEWEMAEKEKILGMRVIHALLIKNSWHLLLNCDPKAPLQS